MKKRYIRIILIIIRLTLGLIFVGAACSKIIAPLEFAGSIENYRVFGILLSRWGAVFLPFFELIVGLMLIFGFWLREAFWLTVVLFLVFDVMIAQAYFRGLDISCGCFSPGDVLPIDLVKIIENILLTALSIIGLLLTQWIEKYSLNK